MTNATGMFPMLWRFFPTIDPQVGACPGPGSGSGSGNEIRTSENLYSKNLLRNVTKICNAKNRRTNIGRIRPNLT